MIAPSDFSALVADVAKLNALDEEAAGDFVALVGDTIEQAEDGRVIVRAAGGEEVARLRWPVSQ